VRANLRAGLALFNDGYYHAAHDPWEDAWLDSDRDDLDGRFLQGLIQLTASVHHARDRNWTGAVGLAESAREYLTGVPDQHRGVDVALVRRVLDTLATDPEVVERRPMPWLTHHGDRVTREDLDFDAIALAADALADERDLDDTVIERAIAYARDDRERERSERDSADREREREEGDRLAAGTRDESGKLARFVRDFATTDDDHDVIYARLQDHVSRRDDRASDVDGLFEES
jgi:hypothetical protein